MIGGDNGGVEALIDDTLDLTSPLTALGKTGCGVTTVVVAAWLVTPTAAYFSMTTVGALTIMFYRYLVTVFVVVVLNPVFGNKLTAWR